VGGDPPALVAEAMLTSIPSVLETPTVAAAEPPAEAAGLYAVQNGAPARPRILWIDGEVAPGVVSSSYCSRRPPLL